MKPFKHPSTELLHLQNSQPIGVGGHRTCYVHPERTELCVKVLHEPWRQINRRLNAPFRHIRPRRHYDENRSEYHELRKLQRKLGTAMTAHFPQVHGLVRTDVGEGLVVDRILDPDGQTSLTLKNYIWLYGLDDACLRALEAFWSFLIRHRVMVRDPMPHNLVVQKKGDGQLRVIMIDGFGSSDLFPFRAWVGSLAEKKLASRRRRMQRQIERHLQDKREGKQPSDQGMMPKRPNRPQG
jgi:hypothetical protein